MARGPEAKLQDKCRKHAIANGWSFRKMQQVAKRGFPDSLFAKKVRFDHKPKFLVEFKKPGEEPTPQQALRHRELRDEGWPVYVVDNFDNFVAILAMEEVPDAL